MSIMLANKRAVRLGVDASLGVASDATTADLYLLAEDVVCEPTAEWIQRKGGGKYLGNTIPGMIGAKTGTISFRTELRTTGALSNDLAIVGLLQGCGMSSSVTAPALVSGIESMKTLTFEVDEDGVMKRIYGAMCELQITGEQGKPCYLEVTAKGMWVTPVAQAMGTWTPTEIQPPILGSGTFTLDSTVGHIGNFTLDLGNTLLFRDDHYAITQRNVTFGCDPEALTTLLPHTKWEAGTEFTTSLTLDDTYGERYTLTMAKCQYMEIGVGNRDDVQTHDLNLQCNISSGDDEFTLVLTTPA